MKEFSYTIKDKDGLHARPAGLIVRRLKEFQSSVTLTCDDRSCDMKALIKLMSLAIKQGETVTITIDGKDEDECFEAIKAEMEERL
ncbi:HPr family phosphocarrier protein [uncultured Methanobrevibacter sp.]|uniref:HPr family phosphocarrier protein n=1 Tax=uncultured Methanobrevibacter sp. TaxID=253161 RepID=UPI00260C9A00